MKGSKELFLEMQEREIYEDERRLGHLIDLEYETEYEY